MLLQTSVRSIDHNYSYHNHRQ